MRNRKREKTPLRPKSALSLRPKKQATDRRRATKGGAQKVERKRSDKGKHTKRQKGSKETRREAGVGEDRPACGSKAREQGSKKDEREEKRNSKKGRQMGGRGRKRRCAEMKEAGVGEGRLHKAGWRGRKA